MERALQAHDYLSVSELSWTLLTQHTQGGTLPTVGNNHKTSTRSPTHCGPTVHNATTTEQQIYIALNISEWWGMIASYYSW